MSKLNNKISTGLEYKNYFNPKFIINVERSTGYFPISLFHINIILKKRSPGGWMRSLDLMIWIQKTFHLKKAWNAGITGSSLT